MARAAIGQICSSASMARNLEQCVGLMSRAAAAGAKVLFLPEASDYIAGSPQESLALARPESSSPFVAGLRAAAAEHRLAVHVGVHVPAATGEEGTVGTGTGTGAGAGTGTVGTTEAAQKKLYNRTVYIDESGELVAHAAYDKLHLFDYPASSLRESATTQAGAGFTPPFASPVGRLGSLVCFDLRFPEAAAHLAQPPPSSSAAAAQVLLYPSAFTVPTGQAHWEVLLRARAIESQSWVVGAAQVGRHADAEGKGGRRVSYGCSMVVDPWGAVVCRLKGVRDVGEGEGGDGGGAEPRWEAEEGAVGELGIVDIDLDRVRDVRGKMPLVRRTDVYPEL